MTTPVTSGHTSIDRFRLRVIAGPDAGRTFTSTRDHAVVGTHESADLVLHDRTVSRFHCDIVLVNGRAVVRDLDSRNGTTIDQVSVLEAHLAQGAVLGLGKTRLRFEIGPDQLQIPVSDRDRFGIMVGGSVAMRAAFALLERASATDATVLLEGETGTGKEAAAESIHGESSRRDGPFVVVDCGAIPPDLLESELFGHEKGAFTGAHGPREGAFEAASGGTIFLDEVGELGPKLQPKLLRALERREVKRVGSNRYVAVDVRVIAATNRTLRAEVNAQRFRSDLFYRLAVIEIRLPPLRERTEDLPGLARHILESLGAADRPEAKALLGPEFLAELGRHSWPGNVRELRNYLERSLALHDPTPPLPEALATDPAGSSIDVDPTQPLKAAREKWLGVFERRYLGALLAKNGGNVTAAARDAGVNRIHLYRLLWRHGLR